MINALFDSCKVFLSNLRTIFPLNCLFFVWSSFLCFSKVPGLHVDIDNFFCHPIFLMSYILITPVQEVDSDVQEHSVPKNLTPMEGIMLPDWIFMILHDSAWQCILMSL